MLCANGNLPGKGQVRTDPTMRWSVIHTHLYSHRTRSCHSPPIAHGVGCQRAASDRMTKTITWGVCGSSSDLCGSSFYARRRFEWYHRGPLTPRPNSQGFSDYTLATSGLAAPDLTPEPEPDAASVCWRPSFVGPWPCVLWPVLPRSPLPLSRYSSVQYAARLTFC